MYLYTLYCRYNEKKNCWLIEKNRSLFEEKQSSILRI